MKLVMEPVPSSMDTLINDHKLQTKKFILPYPKKFYLLPNTPKYI